MDPIKIVLTSCAREKDAVEISRTLLKADLVACCNIIPRVRSLFKWKGKTEDEKEVLLLIKTRAGKVRDVMSTLGRLHEYDLPPVEVLAVEDASKAFGDWIREETK